MPLPTNSISQIWYLDFLHFIIVICDIFHFLSFIAVIFDKLKPFLCELIKSNSISIPEREKNVV